MAAVDLRQAGSAAIVHAFAFACHSDGCKGIACRLIRCHIRLQRCDVGPQLWMLVSSTKKLSLASLLVLLYTGVRLHCQCALFPAGPCSNRALRVLDPPSWCRWGPPPLKSKRRCYKIGPVARLEYIWPGTRPKRHCQWLEHCAQTDFSVNLQPRSSTWLHATVSLVAPMY